MSQLTYTQSPGFTDLADATFDQDKPITDVAMKQLNQNAKAAALRPETFYGWYKNGEVVVLPVSPVDGYAYTRAELEYDIAGWCSRAPSAGAATNGALTLPARSSANGGAGNLYWVEYWVEEKNESSPGLVHTYTSYYVQGGAETVTSDGFVKVRTIATRLSG
jgi:hypothetical protein